MFLHIGNSATVRKKEIIGIFDLDTASMSSDTRCFLREAEKKGFLLDAAGGELPRSFIVSGERRRVGQENQNLCVRLSLISTSGLRLRVLRSHDESDDVSIARF